MQTLGPSHSISANGAARGQLQTGCDDAPVVSVLVVAYNSQDVIDKCLTHIKAAAETTSVEVLLIDNGTGETQRRVESQHHDVRIIRSLGNIGFAAANNELAAHAKGEFLLLVNPDLFLESGAIDRLVRGAREYPDAAAWGGVTVSSDGTPDTGNAIAIPSLAEFASAALGRSMAAHERARDFLRSESVKVLCGGLVMISRKAWVAEGGMDEAFFLYCEEVDFFIRLRQRGFRLYRIADVRGEHLIAHGGNLSSARLMFKTAGTMQYMRKHWSTPKRFVGGALIWLAALERYLAGRLLDRWKPHLAGFAEGYRDVALKPHRWWHGYDQHKGYKAWLDRKA